MKIVNKATVGFQGLCSHAGWGWNKIFHSNFRDELLQTTDEFRLAKRTIISFAPSRRYRPASLQKPGNRATSFRSLRLISVFR